MLIAPIWRLLKITVTDWLDDKAPKLAAALALYTMLSIGPLMVIVLKIVGMVYGDEAAAGKVAGVLSAFAPPQAAEFAQEAAAKAGQPGEGILATIIAVCILFFTATGVFSELQDSLNTIWEVKPKPNQGVWNFVRTRLLSFGMVLGIAFLFMVSTIGTTVLTTLGNTLAGGNNVVAMVMGTLLSMVVMTGLFALIFRVLPDVEIEWRDVLIGAALTAVLFEIGELGLSWYFSRGSTTSVYGAAGSLAVLLLYIYYSAQILFFGAEFTQAYARRHGSGIKPSANAVPTTDTERANQGLSHGMRGS